MKTSSNLYKNEAQLNNSSSNVVQPKIIVEPSNGRNRRLKNFTSIHNSFKEIKNIQPLFIREANSASLMREDSEDIMTPLNSFHMNPIIREREDEDIDDNKMNCIKD